MMIKKYLGVALIAASLAVVGCSSDDDDDGDTSTPTNPTEPTDPEPAAAADPYDAAAAGATESIAAIATADPQFSILLAAVTAAGLDGTLAGDEGGPFTVFAPTNDAFTAAGITEESIAAGEPDVAALTAVLQYHVVGANAYDAAQLSANSGSTLTMLDGNTALIGGGTSDDAGDDEAGDDDVTDEVEDAVDEATDEVEDVVDEATDETDAAEDTPLTIAGVEIATPDQFATNGIVHVIGTVLTPPAAEEPTDPPATGGDDLFSVISADPELSTLAGFLEGSEGTLNLTLGDAANNFTVFAPTNAAFEATDTSALEAVPADLNAALLYHVSDQVLSAEQLTALAGTGGTLAMTSGGSTAITVDDDGNVLVNGNVVSTADIAASNGVVHKIDGVLLDTGATDEADPAEDPAEGEPADDDAEEPADGDDGGDEVVPPAAP